MVDLTVRVSWATAQVGFESPEEAKIVDTSPRRQDQLAAGRNRRGRKHKDELKWG